MKENLDLKLIPYKVLATSSSHGKYVDHTSYTMKGSKSKNSNQKQMIPIFQVLYSL